MWSVWICKLYESAICQSTIRKTKIKFYGFIFSESGFSADLEKIEAIKNVERPKTVAEIRSFLGMTNYVSRFINNYSSITEPLRRLTKQENPFTWTDEQEQAFIRLKESLVSDQVMTYFNPILPSELWVDASPVGVSGILIQNGENSVLWKSRIEPHRTEI